MKRMQSLLLIAAILLTLCACSPSSASISNPGMSTTQPESVLCYDGSQVTIVFKHDFNQAKQRILDKYLAQFQAQYPNITVEHHVIGDVDDVYDQVSAQKGNGNYANVVICQPDHVKSYIEWDIIVSLDDLIASMASQARADGTEEVFGLTDGQIADFVVEFYEDGAHDGAQYTLPLTRYGNVLYYNKEFFDANALSAPATWEEMEALCQRIQQIDPQSTPLLVQTDVWLYYELCAQNGVDISAPKELFGSEQAMGVMNDLCRWEEARYLDTQLELGYPSFADTNDFPRCYMVIDRSFGGGYYYSDFEVGIASVPQMEVSQSKMLTDGLDLCVLKNDNVQAEMASWLLVKFLTTNVDFQAELTMYGGYIPVTNAVMQNVAFAEYISAADGRENLDAQSVKFCTQTGRYYRLPAFAGLDGVDNSLSNLLYQCLYTDTADLQTKIQSELQKLYDKYVK